MNLIFFWASLYWTWSQSLKSGKTTQLCSQDRNEGNGDQTSMESNYPQIWHCGSRAHQDSTHHAHSHCYHNPGLITPSLYRDLVVSDFRNYFYFANFCEQAAVCTWKWSLAKHGSAKWAMGLNAWDLIYFFSLCMELSECGNLHQRRKLFEGSLLSSRKEIICRMF